MIFQNPSLCFYLVIVQLKNFSLTDQMNSDIDSNKENLRNIVIIAWIYV